MTKNDAILITGAAGFIGSHLVDRLLSLGKIVVGLDNFNDYYNPELKEHNLSAALNNKAFHLVRGDIRDSEVLRRISDTWQIDTVVHLAALVGVRNSITKPGPYVDVNVTGTSKLIDWACRCDTEKFILGSTSSVYGDRSKVPFREDDLTDAPCSPYAATKKAAEVVTHAYHSLYGIQVSCLRFFTVYGPRGRPDMAPFKFIDGIYRGETIQQYGDGSSSRDYTYVQDIVKGIQGAVENSYEYEIFNLGNSRIIILSEFIKTIEEILGKEAKIEYLPDQPGDVKTTFADVGKAKQMLGYRPSVSLREGLTEMIEWYYAHASFFKSQAGA
jgi:UDP-glucuronate 4-epimerase